MSRGSTHDDVVAHRFADLPICAKSALVSAFAALDRSLPGLASTACTERESELQLQEQAIDIDIQQLAG